MISKDEEKYCSRIPPQVKCKHAVDFFISVINFQLDHKM